MTSVTPSVSDVEAGQTLLSSSSVYSVVDFIGEGSFGTVAKCQNLATTETVAVKILKKESSHDTEAEASMLDIISVLNPDHTNVVKFYERFEDLGLTFLVFEMLDKCLYDLLHEQEWKPLSLTEIRPIANQLLVALDALKSLGVLHTDIKPENIMLVNRQDQPFRIKLIDFGNAIRASEVWPGMAVQPSGFRAPEVTLGLPFTEAIDIWGVGCILAFLYLADNLFSVECDYLMTKDMIDVLGQPKEHLLRAGKYTKYFFTEDGPTWRLMTPEEYEASNNVKIEERQTFIDLPSSLDDLVNFYADEEAFEFEDRKTFVDLMKQLLHLDGDQRISPHQALQCPFITMSHLTNDPDSSAYLATSQTMMSVCPTGSSATRSFEATKDVLQSNVDGGPSPCSTSWLSDKAPPSDSNNSYSVVSSSGVAQASKDSYEDAPACRSSEGGLLSLSHDENQATFTFDVRAPSCSYYGDPAPCFFGGELPLASNDSGTAVLSSDVDQAKDSKEEAPAPGLSKGGQLHLSLDEDLAIGGQPLSCAYNGGEQSACSKDSDTAVLSSDVGQPKESYEDSPAPGSSKGELLFLSIDEYLATQYIDGGPSPCSDNEDPDSCLNESDTAIFSLEEGQAIDTKKEAPTPGSSKGGLFLLSIDEYLATQYMDDGPSPCSGNEDPASSSNDSYTAVFSSEGGQAIDSKKELTTPELSKGGLLLQPLDEDQATRYVDGGPLSCTYKEDEDSDTAVYSSEGGQSKESYEDSPTPGSSEGGLLSLSHDENQAAFTFDVRSPSCPYYGDPAPWFFGGELATQDQATQCIDGGPLPCSDNGDPAISSNDSDTAVFSSEGGQAIDAKKEAPTPGLSKGEQLLLSLDEDQATQCIDGGPSPCSDNGDPAISSYDSDTAVFSSEGGQAIDAKKEAPTPGLSKGEQLLLSLDEDPAMQCIDGGPSPCSDNGDPAISSYDSYTAVFSSEGGQAIDAKKEAPTPWWSNGGQLLLSLDEDQATQCIDGGPSPCSDNGDPASSSNDSDTAVFSSEGVQAIDAKKEAPTPGLSKGGQLLLSLDEDPAKQYIDGGPSPCSDNGDPAISSYDSDTAVFSSEGGQAIDAKKEAPTPGLSNGGQLLLSLDEDQATQCIDVGPSPCSDNRDPAISSYDSDTAVFSSEGGQAIDAKKEAPTPGLSKGEQLIFSLDEDQATQCIDGGPLPCSDNGDPAISSYDSDTAVFSSEGGQAIDSKKEAPTSGWSNGGQLLLSLDEDQATQYIDVGPSPCSDNRDPASSSNDSDTAVFSSEGGQAIDSKKEAPTPGLSKGEQLLLSLDEDQATQCIDGGPLPCSDNGDPAISSYDSDTAVFSSEGGQAIDSKKEAPTPGWSNGGQLLLSLDEDQATQYIDVGPSPCSDNGDPASSSNDIDTAVFSSEGGQAIDSKKEAPTPGCSNGGQLLLSLDEDQATQCIDGGPSPCSDNRDPSISSNDSDTSVFSSEEGQDIDSCENISVSGSSEDGEEAEEAIVFIPHDENQAYCSSDIGPLPCRCPSTEDSTARSSEDPKPSDVAAAALASPGRTRKWLRRFRRIVASLCCCWHPPEED